MRVVTCAQMKQYEKNADANGLSYLQMMENAGVGAAKYMLLHVCPQTAVVFAGSGNNGGDGLVVARSLCDAGVRVVTVLVNGLPKTPDAVTNFERLKNKAVQIVTFDEAVRQDELCADLFVDAIYGTGFHGLLNDAAACCAKWMQKSGKPVVSLDIPSGVNADSGAFDPRAVRADVTVCFDSYKPAHICPDCAHFVGDIVCIDIGILDAWR